MMGVAPEPTSDVPLRSAASAFRASPALQPGVAVPATVRKKGFALEDAMSKSRPQVVIIGGGFGGLAAARALRKAPVDITLIDRANHHLFQPLLYQVASAALAPGDIAEPIRSVLSRQKNAAVRLAEVVGIDVDAKQIRTDDGDDVPYDLLVVAAGARHAYFGHPEWEAFAPGLKTIDDALEMRRRLLGAFEEAEWTTDPERRAQLLTFVVVGGGPTGVELAGAISDIARQTLSGDFRHISPADAKVMLVEGSGKVLGALDDPLPQHAKNHLESLGVEVRLNTFVTGMDADGVDLGDERVQACTIFWAAGNEASPLGKMLNVPLDRQGRVVVTQDLSIPNHRDVTVIGDLAHFAHGVEAPLPSVAPVAIDMGTYVGRNWRDRLEGRDLPLFYHRDKGSMATIGHRLAVAQVGPLRLKGFVAWVIWLFVHLMTLVGHRNRVLVFLKWAWAWITWERSARLVWNNPRGERVKKAREDAA